MSEPAAPVISNRAGDAPDEKTFRSFTASQGAQYAQYRRNYHASLYSTLLTYHESTGGAFGRLLDVGCGPGLAVRSLAPRFDEAVAVDPSEGMIASARAWYERDGGEPRTRAGAAIRFGVASAETLGLSGGDGDNAPAPAIADGSVDLLVAATAAHWFDLPRFWAEAARVLRPGGTVAVWTSGGIRADPRMPGAVEVQRALDELEERLTPYNLAGNLLAYDMYRTMPLPWALEEPVAAFDEASFRRQEWGTDADGALPGTEYYAASRAEAEAGVSMAMLEAMMATTSSVTRWREAHPDLVGTEQDIVRVSRREVEKALDRSGIQGESNQIEALKLLRGYVRGVMLMVKKRA